MTKATLKQMYMEWGNEIALNRQTDTSLEELKDLCVQYGDGNRWCSWDECLKKIIEGGNSGAITRAFMIYKRHMEIDTKYNTWMEIAAKTNNFNI